MNSNEDCCNVNGVINDHVIVIDAVLNCCANIFRYDIILTSETVYCQASYRKLLSVMEALLKEDGEMLVLLLHLLFP